MVEDQCMTVADVVAQVRDVRLEDFVREAVALVARELIEAGIGEEIGAALGEVAPSARSVHRNGYAPSAWETRVGEIDRHGRAGGLRERRLHRKVDRLVEHLGIDRMTKDQVSALCRALDEQVEAFRQRRIEGAYPNLWLDANQVNVRDHGWVGSKAVVVAYAVHGTGVREVTGVDIGEVESGAFWVEFLSSVRKRGLDAVRLAVSDQHEGLKAATARVLGCPGSCFGSTAARGIH